MIQTIFSGIGLGLTLAIMFGPAFFALLQTSIDKGFGSAFRFAVGICVSDAFLIAVVFLGVASLMEKPMTGNIIGLVGGGMLIGMGAHTLMHWYRGRVIKMETEIKDAAETGKNMDKINQRIDQHKLPPFSSFYVKGFLLNLANPAVWFFWIFSVGLVSSQYITAEGGPNIVYLTIFFACTLGTVLITDILKAFGAHQLKSKVNDQLMAKINLLFAMILVGFGIYLIAKSAYPMFEVMIKYYQFKA